MKYNYIKEELEKVVKKSISFREVLIKINIIPAGGNYKTLKRKIKKWNIDTSHFKGRGWNTGSDFKPFNKKYDIEDILVINSSYTSTDRLKKRLISEGYKIHECELCKLKEWLGKKINLELHHKNGVNNDNRLNNLELLCPNCHSYTENYRGKNIYKE